MRYGIIQIKTSHKICLTFLKFMILFPSFLSPPPPVWNSVPHKLTLKALFIYLLTDTLEPIWLFPFVESMSQKLVFALFIVSTMKTE